MRKGLTRNINRIIEDVSRLECIKPYILAGGTALAMQLGRRLSEDLDFRYIGFKTRSGLALDQDRDTGAYSYETSFLLIL